jgi:hypothetical protein
MNRRLFRRAAAVSAVVAGVAGVIANGCLVLYYALARPWEAGHAGPWEWLGPANDIVGSVSMAALIPVIVYVGRKVPADRLLGVLCVAGVLASSAFALAGPMLVAGVITLETQFVVAGVGLPVIFGWLWRASWSAGHAQVLPPRTARAGELIAIAALAATGVALAGLLLPPASVGQFAVLGVAAVAGLPAYLAFPVWLIDVGRAWWREQPTVTGAREVRRSIRAERPGR